MKSFLKKNLGFTLIELLVVISIIAMLSSIILAALNGARTKGVQGAALEFAATNYHALGSDAYLYMNFDGASLGGWQNQPPPVDEAGNYPWGAFTIVNGGYTADTPSGSGYSIDTGAGIRYPANVGNKKNFIPFGPMTVSVWVKPPATGWTDTVILNFRGSGGGGCGTNLSCIYLHANTVTGKLDFGFSNNLGSVPLPTQLNTWINLTYSWDGSAYTFYVNGNKISYIPNVSLPSSDTWPIALTGLYVIYAGTGPVTGVAIYSSALSANEIKNLYALGAAKHGITLK